MKKSSRQHLFLFMNGFILAVEFLLFMILELRILDHIFYSMFNSRRCSEDLRFYCRREDPVMTMTGSLLLLYIEILFDFEFKSRIPYVYSSFQN